MSASPDRLVYMANQIGAFFASQGAEADAIAGIARHLADFWDPRMRAAIIAHLDGGGAGLHAPVAKAIAILRDRSKAA
jgi:formate dehydrogenase subunit delta